MIERLNIYSDISCTFYKYFYHICNKYCTVTETTRGQGEKSGGGKKGEEKNTVHECYNLVPLFRG